MPCQMELTVKTVTENTDLLANVSTDCEIVIEITDSPPTPWDVIEDNAGIGDKDVTWSADKSVRELADKVDKAVGYSLVEDAEIAKLTTVQENATVNRADSENADKVHTHPPAQVTGLGTFATANYSAAPFINLMPDSGRFAGKTNPLAIMLSGSFSRGGFFNEYNGCVQSDAGKFITNNSTFGGTGSALTEPVQSLCVKTGTRRYGVEFYVMRATAGTGTNAGYAGKYLLFGGAGQAFYASDSYMTFTAWLRSETGAHTINKPYYKDGVLVAANTDIGSEWVHVRVVSRSTTGYDASAPFIYSDPLAKLNIALPAFYSGIVDVGRHTSPLPTINEMSA